MTPNTRPDTVEQSPTITSKWWYWIAAQPISAVLAIIAASFRLGSLAFIFLVILGIAYFIGLVAYAADVKAIATADNIEWTPSRLVYLLLALVFGVLTALFYLYKRHKHVGVP
jgi:predicted outer membrane lipoprotein